MSLRDNLVFYAAMGQTNPPWTQTDYVGGRNLLALKGASAVTGQFGRLATHLDYTIPQWLTQDSDFPFKTSTPFTMAVRVRFTKLDVVQSVHTVIRRGVDVFGPVDYFVSVFFDGSNWRFSAGFSVLELGGGVILNPDSLIHIAVGEWHLVAISWDGNGTFKLWVDGVPASSSLVAAPLSPASIQFRVGRGPDAPVLPMDGDLQDLTIWKRVLSVDEMLSVVAGANPLAVVVDDCNAVACCPQPADDYSASNPSPSGAANSADLCSPVPVTTIDPPSGSTVTFPTFVFLSCNRPDATIYYTTDGTAPTVASPVYAGPFAISNPNQIITAFAQVAGCLAGPTAIAQYLKIASSVFKFGYSCDTTDKMGQWGQFAPNGQPDYHWTLQIQFPAASTIKRMELYQTNYVGVWLSGQAWSTDEFVNPKEGPAGFHVFPLGVFDDGLNPNVTFAFTNQKNIAYAASFGAVAAQQYLWTLIGQPAAPLNGYFKLILFMADGTRMESIIGITCGDPPPPCPGPTTPTLTPTCSGIDVTFTETVGKTFWIYRAVNAPCGDGVFRVLTTGVVASNPQTVHDTGLVDGCQYCYYLAIDNGVCGIQNSSTVCAQKLCLPKVSISVSTAIICGPTLITLKWSSSCVTGNITVTDNHGNTIYNGPGNTTGTAQVTASVDTCWTITGSNACGTATNMVCAFYTPASCDLAHLPATLAVQGWNDFSFFDLTPCSSGDSGPCAFGAAMPSWNGQLARNVGCSFIGAQGYGLFFAPGTPGEGLKAQFSGVQVAFDGTKWVLSFTLIKCLNGSQSGDMDLWVGTSVCNNSTGAGTYTRISGCSTLGSIVIG